MESVGNSLIAYSLGNFVFDMLPVGGVYTRETQEGAVLELTFWGSTLKAARLVPVVIGPDFAPRVAPGAARPGDPRRRVGRERRTAARGRMRADVRARRSHSHITAPTRASCRGLTVRGRSPAEW